MINGITLTLALISFAGFIYLYIITFKLRSLFRNNNKKLRSVKTSIIDIKQEMSTNYNYTNEQLKILTKVFDKNTDALTHIQNVMNSKGFR